MELVIYLYPNCVTDSVVSCGYRNIHPDDFWRLPLESIKTYLIRIGLGDQLKKIPDSSILLDSESTNSVWIHDWSSSRSLRVTCRPKSRLLHSYRTSFRLLLYLQLWHSHKSNPRLNPKPHFLSPEAFNFKLKTSPPPYSSLLLLLYFLLLSFLLQFQNFHCFTRLSNSNHIHCNRLTVLTFLLIFFYLGTYEKTYSPRYYKLSLSKFAKTKRVQNNELSRDTSWTYQRMSRRTLSIETRRSSNCLICSSTLETFAANVF